MFIKIRKKIRIIIINLASFIIEKDLFYFSFHQLVKILPKTKVRNFEKHPIILRLFISVMALARHAINKKPNTKREDIAKNYIIPSLNTLFDKNYVNFAQILLLVVEEFFLAQQTEETFEEVLSLFMNYAEAAGERFRKAFPLPISSTTQGIEKIGFVCHSAAISGFEVIMGLGQYLTNYSPRVYSMRVFDTDHGLTTANALKLSGIELILTDTKQYDVFEFRKLLVKYPVDVAIWSPLPPFHMFFLFAFGLARKQIWLSQYLRPNLSFKYIDESMTLGGAGTIQKKLFNNNEWNIVPQVGYLNSISPSPTKKFKLLLTPARLEKLKQWDFLNCVAEILIGNKNTHFLWTGYYPDKEVIDFFKSKNLGVRNTFIPWMNEKQLINQIKESSLILACFPLSLGTVEYIAAHHKIPILSMFDEEKSLYWRDIYWEACHGNQELKEICFDNNGNSRIPIVKTADEYIKTGLQLLKDPKLYKTYIDVYKKSYDYTYLCNTNNIAGLFDNIFLNLKTTQNE